MRDADLIVAIFWTRIATPTGAASGTVEEIQEHLAAGKPALLYFSTTPIKLDSVDDDQYRAVKECRKTMREQGFVDKFDSLEQFREVP